MREGQRGRRQQIMQRGLNLRPAHGRREFAHFLRRLVLLSVLLTALNLAAAAAFSIFEDESYWQGLVRTLDIVATIGSISHPSGGTRPMYVHSFRIGSSRRQSCTTRTRGPYPWMMTSISSRV